VKTTSVKKKKVVKKKIVKKVVKSPEPALELNRDAGFGGSKFK